MNGMNNASSLGYPPVAPEIIGLPKKVESRNQIPKPSTKSSNRSNQKTNNEKPKKQLQCEMMTPKTASRHGKKVAMKNLIVTLGSTPSPQNQFSERMRSPKNMFKS